MHQLLVSGTTNLPFRFDVVNSELVVDGYQLYVVEKWVVDRDRTIVTLAVYTGDPSHKITASALAPSQSLSPQDAAAEWDRALHILRKDGARPRDTPHGVLMTTSLANFRSDYTIVHIPTGNFRDIQHQLYANINLLRMGCSGRSALSLDEPSDTTKDRFLRMYHIPDPASMSLDAAQIPTIPAKTKSHKKSKSLDPSKSRQQTLDSLRLLPDHPFVSPPSSLVPESYRTAANAHFCTAVIELVRIVQAALFVFGFFPSPPDASLRTNPNIDGLLCDNTVDGIQHWITDIGGPFLGIEPMERVVDPTVVSALLSLILSIRNKLAAIGYSHVVPKDPFLHPHTLTSALSAYIHSSPHAAQSLLHPPHSRGPLPLSTSSSSSNSTSARAPGGNMPTVILTRPLIQAISRAYERVRHTDGRRVHRVFLNRFDDLRVVGGNSDGDTGDHDPGHGSIASSADGTTQILSGIGNLASGLGLGLSGGGGSTGGPGTIFDTVMDLGLFARLVVGHSARDRRSRGKGPESEADWDSVGRDRDKDGGAVGAILSALWSGKIGFLMRIHERERERMERAAVQRKGERDRERAQWVSDGDAEEVTHDQEGAEVKATEDESETGTSSGWPWSDRMQRKIESWAGISKKKQGVDLSIGGASKGNTFSNETQLSPTLPAVIHKHKDRDPGDEEELLSSGQVSPVFDLKVNPLNVLSEGSAGAGLGPSPRSSAFNLSSQSDYERRLSAFNQKRPWGKGMYQSRVSSWSDPLSAQIVEEEDEKGDRYPADPSLRAGMRRGAISPSLLNVTEEVSETEVDRNRREQTTKDLLTHGLKRRHSFHDLKSLQEMRVLQREQMRIDVELCGQLLIMSRRAPHLRNVLACLQLLTASLSETNASLREDYQTHLPALADVDSRTKVIAQIDAQRLRTDMTTQETNTLLYETALFDLRALWHNAWPPRHQVLALREKVTGTGGRRLPRGVHGAHGRYNRLQWTLDERDRLVDWLGRTESEAEEEEAVEVGRVEPPLGEDDEEAVIEHYGMKPVWLLRLFEMWGRWGSTKQQEDEKGKNGTSAVASVTSPSEDASTSNKQPAANASASTSSEKDMYIMNPQ